MSGFVTVPGRVIVGGCLAICITVVSESPRFSDYAWSGVGAWRSCNTGLLSPDHVRLCASMYVAKDSGSCWRKAFRPRPNWQLAPSQPIQNAFGK